jgi:hypothetical protein
LSATAADRALADEPRETPHFRVAVQAEPRRPSVVGGRLSHESVDAALSVDRQPTRDGALSARLLRAVRRSHPVAPQTDGLAGAAAEQAGDPSRPSAP